MELKELNKKTTVSSDSLIVIPPTRLDLIPSMSLLMPFKNDEKDPCRLGNLKMCLKHYNAMGFGEVIVIEQGESPTIKEITMSLNIAGDFTRAELINTGVSIAKKDKILICDSDILLSYDSILATANLLENVDFVKPHCTKLKNLSKPLECFNDFESLLSSKELEYRSKTTLCGTAFAIRKNIFIELGGFDENFVGWGEEDHALSWGVISKKYLAYDGEAIHLFHEKAKNNRQNTEHLKSILTMPLDEYLVQQRQKFEKKYGKNLGV